MLCLQNQLTEFHADNKNDITIVTAIKEYNVPYGVCKTDDEQNFVELEEKPDIKILVNSGMYVIKKEILNLIPSKTYDMTDLIKKTMKNGMKVGVYPISNSDWIDVGSWEEYNKAISNS